MEPLALIVRVAIAVLIVGNVAALIFAFLRYRATRDLPPTLPKRVEAPLHVMSASESARLSELESKFQNIERAFNDLHAAVEKRHLSLTGFISKKLGRAAAAAADDDDDEVREVPKSAFQKLAEIEASQAPREQQHIPNGRRHLRRY